MNFSYRAVALGAIVVLSGCSAAKYGVLERVGIHKRDILASNVEDARDAQADAQEQFQDALERFGAVVSIEQTDLKTAYDRLNDEFEDSEDAAEEVTDQIDDVEEVAEDLFEEWGEEIQQYNDAVLRRDSETKLKDTQARYTELLKTMKDAEASMTPVLNTMRDNVLYLKHNLNSQVVGSLQTTFNELQGDIDILVERMNQSIARSDEFISQLQ